MMKRILPENDADIRRAIYGGEIFFCTANPETEGLAAYVRAMVIKSFGGNFSKAHEFGEPEDDSFFEKVSALRQYVFSDAKVHSYVAEIVRSVGLHPERLVFEPPKLRAVCHDGHHNPAAAPVYFGHRDTWYATPQSTINFWIPLSDLSADETFVFYPEVFDRPIPNDSSGFSFENDELKIGWEKKSDGVENFFPSIEEGFDVGKPLGFSTSFASLLIFSGSHYHQTLKQSRHITRFSLDFRVVNLDDEENEIGAPNVDNESKGSCLSTYLSM